MDGLPFRKFNVIDMARDMGLGAGSTVTEALTGDGTPTSRTSPTRAAPQPGNREPGIPGGLAAWTAT
jgi:hypothetical protein